MNRLYLLLIIVGFIQHILPAQETPIPKSPHTKIEGEQIWQKKAIFEKGFQVFQTKDSYKDYELSIEFKGTGKSILFLNDELDINISPSYGEEASPDICGAINGDIAPILNASLESGWHKLHLTYQILNKSQILISVDLNGKNIHKQVKLKLANPQADQILIHADPKLSIRNFWLRSLVKADHRKLIGTMDENSFKRGKSIYNTLCITCHGTVEKVGNLPTALRFAQQPFKNGSDILTMYSTIYDGYGLMVPQKWMTPQQVYDTIHYVREEFLKKHNPSQYSVPDQKYIDSLPQALLIDTKAEKNKFNHRDRKVYLRMNYGSSLTYSYQVNKERNPNWNIAYKGIAQRLDKGEGGVTKGKNWMIFDKDTMRVAAAWEGKFIDWRSIMFDGSHGTHPKISGDILFTMPNMPAWAKPGTDSFKDTRFKAYDSIHYGPLPKDWARFKGRYVYGDRSVFSYTVGDAEILESFKLVDEDTYSRIINLKSGSKTLYHRIAPESVNVVISQSEASLSRKDGYHLLTVPPGRELSLQIFISKKSVEALNELANKTTVENLTKLTKGGPSQWPEIVETKVKKGNDNSPYAVDEITVPYKNPWNSWMRIGGFDFFKNADSGAICTWDGDVWTFSGLSSGHLTWKRMASGLFQPLGLKIVNEKIYVTCRDQIAIINDLNNDGEADYVECFNGDQQVTDHFHEFAMGLQRDKDGNFYYAKSARHAKKALVPQHGTLMKVSKDGSSTEIIANGFRAANGVCLNPDGTFFVTDQEGHWTPKNRINHVIPNAQNPKFYGNYMGYHDKSAKDSEMDEPLVWLTQKYDRSPAELLWVNSDKWGPVKNSLINLSYGFGRIYVVPHEKANNTLQGGVSALRIPDMPTGTMRGRFHPVDGQLYTAGLFAWASSRQEKAGGFWRIRYTGKVVMQPTVLNVTKKGIKITFSDKLSSTQDFTKLSISTWHIKRTKNYGSKHINQSQLKVKMTKVLPDQKSIFIEVEGMKVTRGMEILGSIRSENGKVFPINISNTVNVLAD